MSNNNFRLDQKIVDLLADLNKAEEVSYPRELRNSRRAAFISAAVGLPAPAAPSTGTPPAAKPFFNPSTILHPFSSLLWNIIAYIAAAGVLVGLGVGIYQFTESGETDILNHTPTEEITVLPLIDQEQPSPTASHTATPTPTETTTPTNTLTWYPTETITLQAPTDREPDIDATATDHPGLHLGETKNPPPVKTQEK